MNRAALSNREHDDADVVSFFPVIAHHRVGDLLDVEVTIAFELETR